MGHFTRHNSFQQDKPIFAFTDGIRTPHSATVSRDFISTNKDGNKSFPAGLFVSMVKGNTRLLPRAKVTVGPTTTSPRFKVQYPYNFIAGDQLTIVEPYVALTVSGTGAATITFSGRAVQVTPIGAGTATEAAVQLANLFDATFLKDYFRFLASGTSLYVFAKDGVTLYTVAGSGTLSAGGAMTVNTTVIGTVSYIDTVTEEIVLSGNAAIVVPIGMNIGVSIDYIIGILPTSGNLTNHRPVMDVGLADEGKVYLGSLPYYDGDIARQLPALNVQLKW